MDSAKIKPKWFLIPMILLCFGAAGSYAVVGNYRMTFYWCSVALVNFAATLLGG